MSIFIYEFVFYIVSVFAIITSLSCGALFYFSYRNERLIRNVWRALGFFMLAAAFFLFILERKNSSFELFALSLELVGTFYIFRGVLAAPGLAHLASKRGVRAGKDARTCPLPARMQKLDRLLAKDDFDLKRVRFTSAAVLATAVVMISILLASINTFIFRFINIGVPSTFTALILCFAFATIILQTGRLIRERSDRSTVALNVWPTLAYVFLMLRELAFTLHRLPESNIVFLRNLTVSYSMTWQIGVLFTFAAFVFLAVWAWYFIKQRAFLRTYVIFLILAVAVASIGALIFTTLVFRIIERNNLDLMTRGVETQEILLDDRSTLALFVARLVSDDNEFLEMVKNNDRSAMNNHLVKYANNANVDILRVFNKFGEVLVSPTDPRDAGRLFSNDELLAYVITKKVQLRTFSTEEGVLTPIIIGRAIHPLVSNGELLGAVEVGYKFDNAFVDYSKEQTGLDVTIYAGSRRSATTIKTVDSVSRWIGSEEADVDVLQNVLKSGRTFGTVTDRLGNIYYSAYKPIRHVNGDIIGMVSVGTPTNILIEDTRQQLLTIFLLTTMLALLAALIAYRAVFWYKSEHSNKPVKKTGAKPKKVKGASGK